MIYPLRPEDAALLVVDVQEEYFDPDGPAYVAEATDRLPVPRLEVRQQLRHGDVRHADHLEPAAEQWRARSPRVTDPDLHP
jgi:nicotinamidase-related amidase